jgi:hypothetical protein
VVHRGSLLHRLPIGVTGCETIDLRIAHTEARHTYQTSGFPARALGPARVTW